jgi:hypothetical protein
MRRPFQPAYGNFVALGEDPAEDVAPDTAPAKKGFQLTSEAQEGIASILVAGTKVAQTAIAARAKKKAKAKAKGKGRKGKKKRTAPAPSAAPTPTVAASEPAPSGVSTQTLLLGLGAFALVGGAAWYMNSKKKAGADVGDV